MLESLFEALKALSTGVPWQDLKDKACYPLACKLTKRFPEYLRTFKAWKIWDEERIAKRIWRSLRDLHRASQVEEASQSMLDNMAASRAKLLVRLGVIAGPVSQKKYLDWEQRGFPAGEVPEMEGQEGGALLNAAAASLGGDANGMTNPQLAHEILFNPGFQLGREDKVGCSMLVLGAFPCLFQVHFVVCF